MVNIWLMMVAILYIYIHGFSKIWLPKNGWFISWKVQMDDSGVPVFHETSILPNLALFFLTGA